MQLNRAPIRLAHDDDAQPAEVDRTAGAITLAGCALTLVAMVMAWGEKAMLGLSLATVEREEARIVLAALAIISAGVAIGVLLRRPATVRVGMLLIVLAAAQVGAAIWFGVTTVNEIRGAHPHLVLITAIGTGVYVAGFGSVGTMIGAFVAWPRRRVA